MSISAQRPVIDPFLSEIEIKAVEDRILLCSDGLWGVVPEAVIQNTIMTMEPQVAANRLVDLANQNQGPDNITALVAKSTQTNKNMVDRILDFLS